MSDATPPIRREFEMSEQQRDLILAASQPVPAMYGSGGVPLFGTVQDNVSRAWKAIGAELGFVWSTARPVPGKPDRFVSAVPLEEKQDGTTQ